MKTNQNVQLVTINCQLDEAEKLEIKNLIEHEIADLPNQVEVEVTISQNAEAEWRFDLSAKYNRGHIAVSKSGAIFDEVRKHGLHAFSENLDRHLQQLQVETFHFDKTGEYDYYTEVSTESRWKPAKLLNAMVLEDDPAAATILRTTLKSMGCKPQHFDVPDKALRAIEDGRYDLLILDWNLPYMMGGDFLKAADEILKKRDLPGKPLRQIPVVVCSSLPIDEIKLPAVSHFTFYNHWHKALPFSSVFGSVDETARKVMARHAG